MNAGSTELVCWIHKHDVPQGEIFGKDAFGLRDELGEGISNIFRINQFHCAQKLANDYPGSQKESWMTSNVQISQIPDKPHRKNSTILMYHQA